MSKGEFFDYDPVTGITEYFKEDADGHWHMTYEQDVTQHLDYAKAHRNAGTADDAWKKQGVATYAHVPLVVIGQMMKKGIRFFDPNHIGRVVQEVNTTYPHLKLTNKHHQVKAG
jgi:hypothetical protein